MARHLVTGLPVFNPGPLSSDGALLSKLKLFGNLQNQLRPLVGHPCCQISRMKFLRESPFNTSRQEIDQRESAKKSPDAHLQNLL